MQDTDNILLNDQESLNFRRNSNTLVILGTGVIVFGFWSVIKLAAQLLFGYQLFDDEQIEELGDIGILISTVTVFIIMGADVILRLIAGLKAISEGRGKKAGKGYLVILMLLILSSAGSLIIVIPTLADVGESFIEGFVSVFMELTSLVITLEVFIAGISVKKHKSKQIGGAG